MPSLPTPQTTAAALNHVVFLRFCFVGTHSVRSCSYEKWLCRGGGEPACLVLSVFSDLILFVLLFFCCRAAALNVVFLRLGWHLNVLALFPFVLVLTKRSSVLGVASMLVCSVL